MAITAALFPPDHPYHWMTIGAADDIRAMQLDDVQAFFRTYYHPSNASLALAGDIDTDARVRSGGALLRRAAAGTPAGAGCGAAAADARDPARARGSRRDAAALHGVALAGDVRRTAMPRWISRRSARQRQDVAAVSHARLRAAHRARRVGVPELARARQLLPARGDRGAGPLAHRYRGGHRHRAAGARRRGPLADEMERAAAQVEAHFMYRLQTVGGFGGKSDQLNAYNVFRATRASFQRTWRATGWPRRRASGPRWRATSRSIGACS